MPASRHNARAERFSIARREYHGALCRLEDPRLDRTKAHALLDILVIAICAIICGANDWEAVAEFGRSKVAWFKSLLPLPNGIPSHDTFWRVFRALDPAQFQSCFVNWMRTVSPLIGDQVVAIDGKQLRRSHDKGLGQAAIYMVSAWATANRLVLGQRKVADKSNEITAIPQLLQALDLRGCLVTIDAIGCQTSDRPHHHRTTRRLPVGAESQSRPALR